MANVVAFHFCDLVLNLRPVMWKWFVLHYWTVHNIGGQRNASSNPMHAIGRS